MLMSAVIIEKDYSEIKHGMMVKGGIHLDSMLPRKFLFYRATDTFNDSKHGRKASARVWEMDLARRIHHTSCFKIR